MRAIRQNKALGRAQKIERRDRVDIPSRRRHVPTDFISDCLVFQRTGCNSMGFGLLFRNHITEVTTPVNDPASQAVSHRAALLCVVEASVVIRKCLSR